MFAFGVGAGIGLSLMMGQNSPEIVIPENHDVFEAYSIPDIEMDTEKGEITIIDDTHLPKVLPLCITDEWLSQWWVEIKVTGGYDPLDGDIDLSTIKCGDVGSIDIDFKHIRHEPCYADYYNVTFDLPCGAGPIELESNQWPVDADPIVCGNPTIPGKKVLLEFMTWWQGCGNRDQKFKLILTHKSDVFRVPSSE